MLLVGDVESQVARFAVLEKRHGKGVVDHPVGLGFRDVMVADILRGSVEAPAMQRAAASRRRLVTVDDDRVDRVDADIGLGLVVYVVDGA